MAETKLGKSLDALIEENRSKIAGAGKKRSTPGGGARPAARQTSVAGGRRVGRVHAPKTLLKGIAGLTQGGSRSKDKQEVVVGNTRYVKAQVPGVSNAGVSKAGGGGRRRGGGGGGAAAAFAHDDRTGMGGFADDSYAFGGGGGGGGGDRMGGRSQRGSAAGIGGRWQHDLFDPQESAPVTAPRRAGRLAGASPTQPTRVSVSNLAFSVTKQDLMELFSSIGEVISATIDFDRTGRSNGTAQVMFRDRSSAEQALVSYNGVKLDNRVMQLAIDDVRVQVLSSGKSVQFPGNAPAPAPRNTGLASRVLQQSATRPVPSGGRGRGGGGRLRSVVGGSRGRSAADLNNDLDDYMQE